MTPRAALTALIALILAPAACGAARQPAASSSQRTLQALQKQVQDLKTQLAAARKEQADQIAALRKELQDGLAALRQEQQNQSAAVQKQIQDALSAARPGANPAAPPAQPVSLTLGTNPVKGAKTAKLVFMEFSDFQ